MKNTLTVSFSLLFTFIVPALALGAGVPICTAPDYQQLEQLMADGPGSGVLTWVDKRGSGNDLYVQRINGSALPQWTSNGVPLTTTGNAVTSAYMVSDGAGGVIFTWSAWGSGGFDIYAQRIDAAGTALWAAGGILISDQGNDEWINSIISDGAGGAIFAWVNDLPYNSTISAQRVNASGLRLWPTAGVQVSGGALGGGGLDCGVPWAVPDGAGGAIVVWSGVYLRLPENQYESDVYAQRINASGGRQWGGSGVLIGPLPDNQYPNTILSDDAGGAIVIWDDVREAVDNGNSDIYTQRLSPSGAQLWDPNGVAVTTATGSQYVTGAIPDGAGGAFMSWGGKSRPWLQHVSAAGVAQYVANGIMISKYESYGQYGSLAPDGAGGVIVTWSDLRNGGTGQDIYAQRFNGSGVPLWTSWGVPVSTEYLDQKSARLVPDGSGGALIVWQDRRNWYASSDDIFGQRISANGVVTQPTVVGGTRTPSLLVSEAHPNPFAEQTSFNVVLPGASPVTAEVFDVVGRRVRTMTISHTGAGPARIVMDGRDQKRQLLPSGVYFCRIRAGTWSVTKKMVIAR